MFTVIVEEYDRFYGNVCETVHLYTVTWLKNIVEEHDIKYIFDVMFFNYFDVMFSSYGLATINWLLEILGLFCRI